MKVYIVMHDHGYVVSVHKTEETAEKAASKHHDFYCLKSVEVEE